MEGEQEFVLRLCHTQECCPKAKVARNGDITITDDGGGGATLSMEQLFLLVHILRERGFFPPRR